MEFSRVALVKLNDLLNREKFVKVAFVGDGVVRINYTDRECTITNFGKVMWTNL